MTKYDEIEDVQRRLLPRVAARSAEISEALAEGAKQGSGSARQLGLNLAGRFPELEGVAAAIGSATNLEDPAIRAVVDSIERSSTLSLAISSAFPLQQATSRERIVFLVADPLVDSNGDAVGGEARWFIPWVQVEDKLRRIIDQSGRSYELIVTQATRASLASLASDARVVILISHGFQLGEEDKYDSGVVLEKGLRAVQDVVPSNDIGHAFHNTSADVVLLLSCHAGPTARAIHRAGVATVLAVDADAELPFDEAVDIATAFLEQWVAGVTAQQAMTGASKGRTTLPQVTGSVDTQTRAGAGDGTPAIPIPTSAIPVRWFKGQETSLSRSLAALADGRPVVISGAPGIGKTQLARAVLSRVHLGEPSKQAPWFVSLEETNGEPELFLDLIRPLVTSMGVEADDLSLSELADIIGATRMGLVLDNAESLTSTQDGAKALTDFVASIAEFRKARLVVTTRNQLPFDVNLVENVRPTMLSQSESIALLSEIVGEPSHFTERASQPHFAKLLELAGGHPLTLKIIGSLLKTESALNIVQLFDRASVAEIEGHQDRVKSLTVSLQLSWNRLNELERSVWSGIAQLAIGLPLTTELQQEELGARQRLSGLNLIEEQSGAFRVLPAMRSTVRLFGGQNERSTIVRSAMAATESLLAKLSPLIGSDRNLEIAQWFREWLPQVDQVLEFQTSPGKRDAILSEAIQFALMGDLLLVAKRWLETASGIRRQSPTQMGLDQAAARLALREDRLIDAHHYVSAARETAAATENQIGLLNAEQFLGDLAMREDRTDDALRHLTIAVNISKRLGAQIGVLDAESSLGDVALKQGRVIDARAHLETARDIAHKIGQRLGEFSSERSLGEIAMREGRLADAHQHLGVANEIAKATGVALGEISVAESLGKLALREDRLEDALCHFTSSRDLAVTIKAHLAHMEAEQSLGMLAIRADRLNVALGHLSEARRIAITITSSLGLLNAEQSLGQLALQQDQLTDAKSHLEEALKLATKINNPLGLLNVEHQLGELAMRVGDQLKARMCFAQAKILATEINEQRGLMNAERALGDLAVRENRFDDARTHLKAALTIANQQGQLDKLNAEQSLGNLAMREDRLAEARTHFRIASKLGEAIGARLGKINAEHSLGLLAIREGHLGEAKTLLANALDIALGASDRLSELNVTQSLGDLAMREDRLDEARTHLTNARDIAINIGARLGELNAEQSLGQLDMREDRLDEARTHLTNARDIAINIGARFGELNAEQSLGQLDMREDRLDEARTHLTNARDIAIEINDRYSGASVLSVLAQLTEDEGRPEEALSIWAQTALSAHETGGPMLRLAGQVLLSKLTPLLFTVLNNPNDVRPSILRLAGGILLSGDPGLGDLQNLVDEVSRQGGTDQVLRDMRTVLEDLLNTQFSESNPQTEHLAH